MKSLEAQTHYEVLEVSRIAKPEEIERAYQMATATWSEGSLALYSIFDDSNAEAVRERIHRAYRVLADEEARHAYDAATFDSPPEPEETPRVLSSDVMAEDTIDDVQAALDGQFGEALDGGELGFCTHDRSFSALAVGSAYPNRRLWPRGSRTRGAVSEGLRGQRAVDDRIGHACSMPGAVAPGTIELRNHSFDAFGALDGIRGGGVGKFVERYMD